MTLAARKTPVGGLNPPDPGFLYPGESVTALPTWVADPDEKVLPSSWN